MNLFFKLKVGDLKWFLIIWVFLLSSCAEYKFGYTPKNFETTPLKKTASLSVKIKNSSDFSYGNLVNLKKDIKKNVEKELSDVFENFSRRSKSDIHVTALIELSDNNKLYGLFYFPLWFVGLPVGTYEVKSKIGIVLKKSGNKVIKKYFESCELSEVHGLYYDRKTNLIYDRNVFGFPIGERNEQFLMYKCFRSSFKKLKAKILYDKNKIYSDYTISSHANFNNDSRKLPPILSIQNISFSKSILEAQNEANLTITLKNTGAGKAQDVHVKLSSKMDEYLEYPSKKYFDPIEKEGGKATLTIPVKAKKDIPSGKARMDIQVVEPNFHVNIQGKRLVFETQKFQTPNLVLAKFAAKESRAANPDQKIGINEQMKLKILPQNVGKQEAEDIKIQVKNEQKGVQFLGYGEGDNLSMDNPEYPSIDVGDYKKLTANYFINSRFEADSLRFTIKGEEKYGEYGFSQTKTIPINNQVKAEGNIKKVEGPEGEKGDQEVKIKDLPSFGIDVEQNIPETSTKQPNTYALIIGNENYTKYQSSLSQESNVDFAKRDAEIFAKYVRKTLGVPSDNIRVKTNLTAATMKRQIEWLQTRSEYASDSVQLIFYYSGHGFPNPETKEKYLMPVDVTGAQVTQGIQLGDLYDQLTQHKTKRTTLFLDACFSGAGREQGLLAAKSVKVEPKENAIMDGKLVAFSSSQGDQQSFFYKQKKHGLFTYYLLKKLKQTKGEVTYGKLYNYVKNKVPFQSTEIYGAEQVPGVKFSRAVKREWKNWKIK